MDQVNLSLDEEFANYTFELTRSELQGSDEIKNNIFAPTINRVEKQLQITTIDLPRIWKEYREDTDPPEWSYNFEPRLLMRIGNSTTEDWIFKTTTRTAAPYFTMLDLSNDDYSILFNDSSNSDGLYTRFYKNYKTNTTLADINGKEYQNIVKNKK